MTREEAIGTLQAHVVFACEKAMLSSTAIRMIEDALDMAIEALEHPPITAVMGTCPRCGCQYTIDLSEGGAEA